MTLDNPILQAVERLMDKRLEATGLDWYNNDGGFGSITISRDLRVKLNVSLRIPKTEDHHFLQDLTGKPVRKRRAK